MEQIQSHKVTDYFLKFEKIKQLFDLNCEEAKYLLALCKSRKQPAKKPHLDKAKEILEKAKMKRQLLESKRFSITK